MKQKILTTNSLELTLTEAISECEHERIFILTDETTCNMCWPVIKDFLILRDAKLITIPSTDTNKNLHSLSQVWETLAAGHATRHALLINLGGGMVTDLGGFAASTYKRGIDFINIPTTLLGMVDASIGGKTGINFYGMKNEIGVFNEARYVILYMPFLKTLDHQNILSGYAEMIKHGLINNKSMLAELLNFDWRHVDFDRLGQMVTKSLEVKQDIVKADPHEYKQRKALNLGHTFAHAFEEFSLRHDNNPILHGYAVAYGLVAELHLSIVRYQFNGELFNQTIDFIYKHYGMLSFTRDDYPELIELMQHDKKNYNNQIITTLLADIGNVRLNQYVSDEEIKKVLDFCRNNIIERSENIDYF